MMKPAWVGKGQSLVDVSEHEEIEYTGYILSLIYFINRTEQQVKLECGTWNQRMLNPVVFARQTLLKPAIIE